MAGPLKTQRREEKRREEKRRESHCVHGAPRFIISSRYSFTVQCRIIKGRPGLEVVQLACPLHLGVGVIPDFKRLDSGNNLDGAVL
jgi:hypothetical protein